jgi:hypothetical protein
MLDHTALDILFIYYDQTYTIAYFLLYAMTRRILQKEFDDFEYGVDECPLS